MDCGLSFTKGALKGGTHTYIWNGDGKWVGFTYNDDVLVSLERKGNLENDLRVVGFWLLIDLIK